MRLRETIILSSITGLRFSRRTRNVSLCQVAHASHGPTHRASNVYHSIPDRTHTFTAHPPRHVTDKTSLTNRCLPFCLTETHPWYALLVRCSSEQGKRRPDTCTTRTELFFRAQTFLDSVGTVLSPLRIVHCGAGFEVTEDTPFTSYALKYNSMARRKLLMRGQATRNLLGRNLSRSMMCSSLPALLSKPSDQFYDTVEIPNPPTVQMKAARRKEHHEDALYGPER